MMQGCFLSQCVCARPLHMYAMAVAYSKCVWAAARCYGVARAVDRSKPQRSHAYPWA
jgi:hypothetical protein